MGWEWKEVDRSDVFGTIHSSLSLVSHIGEKIWVMSRKGYAIFWVHLVRDKIFRSI